MLNSLMYTSVNGPAIDNCKAVVKEAVNSWLSAKKREKLHVPKKVKLTENQIVIQSQSEDNATQTTENEIENVCNALDIDSEEMESDTESEVKHVELEYEYL